MQAERRPLEEIAAADWDRLCGDSFFASRGFVDLWRSTGGRPVGWILEADGRPAAFVPGVEYGRGPITRFLSLPDGCYGGVCVVPELEHERGRLGAALLDAIARFGYAKCCVFDFYDTVVPHAAFSVAREQAVLADIADPAWTPDAKLRAQVRRAEREGIRVERFDWDRHAAGFLALVATSSRQHRRPPRHSRSFYRALTRLAARDERVWWLYCERDGRPVASHIYFVECDMLQAWQSHFDREFSYMKPNAYIRYTLCREIVGRGVRRLNLGSSPARADGLASYKIRWGGYPVRYTCWTRWQGLGAFAHAWYRWLERQAGRGRANSDDATIGWRPRRDAQPHPPL